MPDEQDRAEALDDEVLDRDSDIDPDFEVENDLKQFPGDRYLGVNEDAVTVEGEHQVESDEDRTAREEPDPLVDELNRQSRRDEIDDRLEHDGSTEIDAMILDAETRADEN